MPDYPELPEAFNRTKLGITIRGVIREALDDAGDPVAPTQDRARDAARNQTLDCVRDRMRGLPVILIAD